MTHQSHKAMPLIMGLIMGAMIPFMVHGNLAEAGALFVLAHVAALAAALSLAVVFPRVRAALRHHRPNRAMLTRMALAALADFALVCTHCLATLHGAT